ncbi:MAG: primase [Pseudomonadota bacterium]|jgi:DNA primase
MSFTPQFLDEIRARVGLVDRVARKVKLTRKGREFSGLCPFHNEKTPSFTVNEEKGFYHCFGCGAHGDVIGFVMRAENLSFPETVERLAEDAGLELPRSSPEERSRAEAAVSLYAVCEAACAFFERELRGPRGQGARDYLKGRGLDEETIARFRLGYAPDSRSALKTALMKTGMSESLLVTAGLLIQPEDERASYDRFRGRVIFPIFDRRGRVIAFGGRIMGEGEPKYLNSPETPLFQKGHNLYGWSHSLKQARETGLLFLTEGYMDVIALVRAGFPAMAPLGTALTESQIEALWRVVPEPVLCFDGDAAGQRAAARAAERALALLRPGHSLRFVELPKGEDPDSLVRKRGRAGIDSALAQARPMSRVIWDLETRGKPVDTPERRALVEKNLMARARSIADRAVQEHYVGEFRARLREAFADFSPVTGARRRMGQGGGFGRGSFERARGGPLSSDPLIGSEDGRAEARERVLVACILNHPDLLAELADDFARVEIGSHEYDSLRQAILDVAGHHAAESNESLDAARLARALAERGFVRTVEALTGPAARVIDWFARAGAAHEDALIGFRQVLALHRRFGDLQAALAEGEDLLAADMTEEQWERFRALKAEAEAPDHMAAEIEEFGQASGRKPGG